MCLLPHDEREQSKTGRTVAVGKAVGAVLAHDITEIIPGEFKGCAFRKGHVIRQEDICRLQRLGKEHLFVLDIADDEIHEDEAARALAEALVGEGVRPGGGPREGKINILAARPGLLRVNRHALCELNRLGDVVCATLHDNTVVQEGQIVGGTRAIPLIIKRRIVEEAVNIACAGRKILAVKEMRKPKAGVVITGSEVYYGRIQDGFGPVIRKKIEGYGGEVKGIYFAPDDDTFIAARLRELIDDGCDLLITTGGMSVDPDDVTRFAIRHLGAEETVYGSPVLPGSMFLVAYLKNSNKSSVMSNALKKEEGSSSCPSQIPILGIPACGLHDKVTVFDLLLPRVLAGEKIGRNELAELGHGGLCMHCPECRYPVCPFGKA